MPLLADMLTEEEIAMDTILTVIIAQIIITINFLLWIHLKCFMILLKDFSNLSELISLG